MATQSMQPGV